MNEPVFLDLEDVLLIHDEQLAKYGGAPGLRQLELLESAVAMARAKTAGCFFLIGLSVYRLLDQGRAGLRRSLEGGTGGKAGFSDSTRLTTS